jgi:hypothetical protein
MGSAGEINTSFDENVSMDRSREQRTPEFLRQETMKEMIASERDPITAQLMTRAVNMVFLRLARKEKGPTADFDLAYFIEVIKEFADDHEALRTIIEGRGAELDWLAEE